MGIEGMQKMALVLVFGIGLIGGWMFHTAVNFTRGFLGGFSPQEALINAFDETETQVIRLKGLDN